MEGFATRLMFKYYDDACSLFVELQQLQKSNWKLKLLD